MFIYYTLKNDAKILAAGSRILRQTERQLKAKAAYQKAKGINSMDANALREQFYGERIALRKVARSTHLARAFLSDRPYFEVEQSVREGNEPTVDSIMGVLEAYGLEDIFEEEHVVDWLNGVA